LEIFTFLYYANEKNDDVIGGSTKMENKSRDIKPEILKQCSSNLAPAMNITKETQ